MRRQSEGEENLGKASLPVQEGGGMARRLVARERAVVGWLAGWKACVGWAVLRRQFESEENLEEAGLPVQGCGCVERRFVTRKLAVVG